MSGLEHLDFKSSSFCGSCACVEVAIDAEWVHVRDSKVTDGPVLMFTKDEWTVFMAGVKAGEFAVQ